MLLIDDVQMNVQICVVAGAALLSPLGAAAAPAGTRYWQAPVQDIATVQAVQRALRAEGYDTGPTDGTLNAKTVQALRQAQEKRGLEPTGKVDRLTAAALGVNPETARSRPDAGFVVHSPGG